MRAKKSSGFIPPDLPGEPEGWRELQERARQEKDSAKLEAIIAEMNQLLAECERKATNGNGRRLTSRRGIPKRALVEE